MAVDAGPVAVELLRELRGDDAVIDQRERIGPHVRKVVDEENDRDPSAFGA